MTSYIRFEKNGPQIWEKNDMSDFDKDFEKRMSDVHERQEQEANPYRDPETGKFISKKEARARIINRIISAIVVLAIIGFLIVSAYFMLTVKPAKGETLPDGRLKPGPAIRFDQPHWANAKLKKTELTPESVIAKLRKQNPEMVSISVDQPSINWDAKTGISKGKYTIWLMNERSGPEGTWWYKGETLQEAFDNATGKIPLLVNVSEVKRKTDEFEKRSRESTMEKSEKNYKASYDKAKMRPDGTKAFFYDGNGFIRDMNEEEVNAMEENRPLPN